MDALQPLPASHRLWAAIVMISLGLLWANAAMADVIFGNDRELLAITSQNSFRSWTVEDENTGESHEVRQLASRFHSTFDLGERVDLVFYTSGGFSQDRREDVASLDGLADVKLKSFFHLMDSRLLLATGVSLPTGRTTLGEKSIRVANAVAPNVLGFKMRNFGGGFDVDLGMAFGQELRENLVVGGGISTMLRGSYDLDQSSEYTPAPEIALTLGADLKGGGWKFTTDLVYRIFGTDQMDGDDSYQDGNQLEISALWSARGSRWGLDALVKNIKKAESEHVLELPPASDTRVENGNNFWLTLMPRLQSRDEVAFKGILEYVAVNQSQQQQTSAWAMGFGGGIEIRLTEVSIFEARLMRLTGSSEDKSMELSGFEGLISLRWQY